MYLAIWFSTYAHVLYIENTINW